MFHNHIAQLTLLGYKNAAFNILVFRLVNVSLNLYYLRINRNIVNTAVINNNNNNNNNNLKRSLIANEIRKVKKQLSIKGMMKLGINKDRSY